MMSMRRVAVGARYAGMDQLRRPLTVLLPVLLPIYLIVRSVGQTLPTPRRVELAGGEMVATTMRDLHGLGMGALAVAFVAALLGVFSARSSLAADRRLAVAGFTTAEVIAARLLPLLVGGTVVAAVAALVTAATLGALHWWGVLIALWLTAVTYAAIGALVGTLFDLVAGTYLALVLVLVDLGVVQSPMFNVEPPRLAWLLPSYGAGRSLFAAALEPGLAWLPIVGLAAAIALVTVVALVWAMSRRIRVAR